VCQIVARIQEQKNQAVRMIRTASSTAPPPSCIIVVNGPGRGPGPAGLVPGAAAVAVAVVAAVAAVAADICSPGAPQARTADGNGEC